MGTQDATILAALIDLLGRSLEPLDHQLVTALITTLTNQKLTTDQQRLVDDAKRTVSYVAPPTTQFIPMPCKLPEP